MNTKHTRIVALLCILTSFSISLSATDYYWVGGGGNWSDLNHWVTTSGGSTLQATVPQSTDDVFFDANSGFTAGDNIVFIDKTIIFCRNIDWTAAPNSPEFTGDADKQWYVFGSVQFIPDMNFSFSGEVHFQAFDMGHTITSAGQMFNQTVYFEGIGGEWTLLDDFTGTRIEHDQGTLRTNNQTVNLSDNFRSGGSDNIQLYLGTSVITCGSSFSVNHYSNSLFDSGTSTIILTNNNYTNIQGCGQTFYNVEFLGEGSISCSNQIFNEVTFHDNGNIHGDNIFHTLNFSPGRIYELNQESTQTILPNGTLNASGTDCNEFVTIKTNGDEGQATINHSGSAIILDYVTLLNSAATGGANFTINNGVDLGNNTGWMIIPPTSRDLYWVGGEGNWMDVSHWSVNSGGTGGECIPTAYDNVFFDANSGFVSGSMNIVNVDQEIIYCHDMTWSGVQHIPTLQDNGSIQKIYIFGSLELDANMINSYYGEFVFMADTQGETIRLNGQYLNQPVQFVGIGGEWTFLDAFAASAIYHQQGILRTNNQTVNSPSFFSKGNELYLGESVITVNSFSLDYDDSSLFDSGTSTIILESGSINGCGQTFYNVEFLEEGYLNCSDQIFNEVTFNDNGNISGNNTFHTLNFSPGHTYILNAGSTQTITPLGNFNANGNGSFPIEFKSNQLGNQATLHKDGDPVCLDFLFITDLAATGTGFSYVGANSDDVQNNSGWIFEECPACFTAPLDAMPTLAVSSNLMVDAGNTATLILDNLPANVEAVWYTEDQVSELYNDGRLAGF